MRKTKPSTTPLRMEAWNSTKLRYGNPHIGPKGVHTIKLHGRIVRLRVTVTGQ